MKRAVVIIVCVSATCVFVKSARVQTVPPTKALIQPFTMREDFQGDSLGQFASYPPAQDVGYEPSLAPTSMFDAPGGRSLMRVVKPNVPGALRLGFIRKVRIVISDGASLSFAYRVNSPRSGAQIEIGLAGANGILYTRKVIAQTNRWTVIDTKLSELRDSKGIAPPTAVRVDAIYLVASLDQTDPDMSYRFLIDDLSLQAAREARFDVNIPATEAIDPWPELVSDRGFRALDKIAFETTAPANLASVNCTLKTSGGRVAVTQKLYDDGTHGDRQKSDGIWSNNSVYSISANDETGLWNAQLEGSTANGETISTVVRFIVHPANKSGHPQLFFAKPDRQKLIARSRDPKLTSLWSHLQTTAKNTRVTGELAHGGAVFEMLDREYLLPSLLAYFDVLNRARSRIAHNSFEAYLTDSVEARTAAKSAMLEVARWKRWQPPWFEAHGQHTYYPAGLLAADVALGYDLLYDSFTAEERAQIRQALIDKSIIPTYKEYVADNRVMVNTSNWIAHTVGGALIAAASIASDVHGSEPTSKSNARFEVYLHGLLMKLEDHMAASFLADGSYGEGISYHEFDMETLGPALNALRRVFGIDYWKQTHVLDSLYYPLYTLTQPTSGSLDMGDTHAPAGHGISPLVYESKDPVMRWYFAQFDRPSLSKFIFYDDSVASQPPGLPTSRIFQNKGNAVFRSGWDKDAIVFLYRAGPNFNHHHADQGSFLLSAFGENLVSEAGWSDYYKDPYYATFFTQAIGHSTVLVDGNPESQSISDTPQFSALNRYPRISDSITSEFYDGLGSDLSSVYQNRLARYIRRVAFIKPNYFVVFDDLKVNGQPARFDFLLHLPDRAKIKVQDSTATYNGDKASLAVRLFESSGANLSLENGRVPYHIFAARTPDKTPAQPAYLAFKTANPTNETQFLTAIVPAKNESAAQSLINQITEVVGENLKAVRVSRGDERDLVMFRIGAAPQTIQQGEWSADAASVVVTQRGNDLKSFAIHEARTLQQENQVLFSSDSPISVAASFSAKEIGVVTNAEAAATITLFVRSTPIRILLDGQELSPNAFSFNQANRTISLNVPMAQHGLKIIFAER